MHALSGYGNMALLAQQVRRFDPKMVVLPDEGRKEELFGQLNGNCRAKILYGEEGLCTAACEEDGDVVVTAVSGAVGIRPTVEAVSRGKTVALANKETLVAAGSVIMPLAEKSGAAILPVDSEHSAIFQCLQGNPTPPSRLILTASGGPFRGFSKEQLACVTPEDALKHPNWTMGKKITVDSATLMNKGLELLEAQWLFGVKPSQIHVVVHPQSIVHSAVAFADGAVIAQLSVADMKLPIQYALTYPARCEGLTPPLDLTRLSGLTFEEPDEETFLPLKLCRLAAERGGTLPTALNAANEVLVGLFLENKISFTQIFDGLQTVFDTHISQQDPSLEQILLADRQARLQVLSIFTKGAV